MIQCDFSVFVADKNRPTRRLDYVISDNGLIAPVASFTRKYALLAGMVATFAGVARLFGDVDSLMTSTRSRDIPRNTN